MSMSYGQRPITRLYKALPTYFKQLKDIKQFWKEPEKF